MPIIGGTSGDNMQAKVTFQFVGEQILERGILLIGYADPSLSVVTGVHHGSLAIGKPFEVTKAEANRIYELDGEPAWPHLMKTLDLDPAIDIAKTFAVAGLGQVVDQLKSFVRLDEAEKKIVDLRDSVQNAAYLVAASHAGEIEVETDLSNEPCPIDCYPARISEALLHLLQNAANAMSGKGTIHIEVAPSAGQVQIVIADTGSGIKKDQLAKLFEPAFTDKGGAGRIGLGMGLAIVRRIVNESDGTLQIQSERWARAPLSRYACHWLRYRRRRN